MSEIAEADERAQRRSHSLQGASSLGLLRCWYHAQLLHQAHHVEQTPELHDLAAADPVEDATWHLNTLASGRDALQFTSVRAPTGPPLGHLSCGHVDHGVDLH